VLLFRNAPRGTLIGIEEMHRGAGTWAVSAQDHTRAKDFEDFK